MSASSSVSAGPGHLSEEGLGSLSFHRGAALPTDNEGLRRLKGSTKQNIDDGQATNKKIFTDVHSFALRRATKRQRVAVTSHTSVFGIKQSASPLRHKRGMISVFPTKGKVSVHSNALSKPCDSQVLTVWLGFCKLENN